MDRDNEFYEDNTDNNDIEAAIEEYSSEIYDDISQTREYIELWNKVPDNKSPVVLDLSDVSAKEELHARVRDFFGFPDYYGGNLDALYDCLTDITEKKNITIILPEKWPEDNNKYIKRFIKVFEDAASSNGNLMILFSY